MIFEQFHQMILSTAISFRLGMEAQASEGLVALIDALPQVLADCSEIDTARLNLILATMLAAQSRKDYIYLADLLQYELASQFNGDSGSQPTMH